MKIRFFSDTHREISRYYKTEEWMPTVLPDDANTVLVLAGDIEIHKHINPFLERLAERFKAVVFVFGNHEFYGDSLRVYDRVKRNVIADNIHVLQNDTVTIDGQRFVGTTLWGNLNDIADRHIVQFKMNCFKRIRFGLNGNFRPINGDDVFQLYVQARAFLMNTVKSDDVVVTHMSPLSPYDVKQSTNYGYGSSVNATDWYYHTGIMHEFDRENIALPKLWIHGHDHSVRTFIHGDMTVRSNCVGYPGETKDKHCSDGVINL